MLLRPKLAGLLVTFMASAALLFSGCSSSQPRDLNYGTDVGLGYVPPDVAPTATEAGTSEAGRSAESGSADEAGGTFDGAADAGISVDSVADVNAAADADVSVDAFIDGDG
jgi:hypothetical protein